LSLALGVQDVVAEDAGSSVVSREALLELLVLADRADLWASMVPGIGHDLANALMSLSFPGDHTRTREAAQARVERAHRVLNGMSDGPRGLPMPIVDLFEDVLASHRMQVQLPFCKMSVSAEPELTGTGDMRLHQAILGLITGAKEAGATSLELRTRRVQMGFVVEIEATGVASAASARRGAVAHHLLAGLGGDFEVIAAEGGTTWRITLPSLVVGRGTERSGGD
jgi:hypothetical protein